MLGGLKIAAGMGNFRLARHLTATQNLEPFTRLDECLGDLALSDH
jgi:hypothetical protein